MLHIIKGRAGSGKTQYMIECLKEMQSMGMDCLFLVPEQNCMETELRIEKEGGQGLNTEVLNFERLPNHVFRTIGGLESASVDVMGRCVLIASAVSLLGNKLSLFGKLGKGILGDLSATVSALKRLCVSPKHLEEICDRMEEKGAEEGVVAKIRETALVYAKYEELLGEGMYDDDDALTRLADAPGAADFFRGKALFIDGIYTYTPQQYRIIELMANNAAELYISFTVDKGEIFNGTADCIREIVNHCNTAVDYIDKIENHRIKNQALLYGEKLLFSGHSPYEKEAEGIELVGCETIYDEAQYTAKCIYTLREKGLRFDEIAVAVRNPSSYAGVLDTVLAGYGIPFYFGSKDSAATKPLIAAIIALLEMANGNFPLLAIKKYLKSTYSALSDAEADTLIRYAESWDIRGKLWISDKDWLMHPEGYKAQFTAEEEALLTRINTYRREFAQSVLPVIESLKDRNLTVGKAVKAIYTHLTECAVEEKLKRAIEKLELSGDSDGAKKTATLWDAAIDMFDRLYSLVGDTPTTPAKLITLIESMAESIDIGAIPSYTDAVNIGDARLMRAEGVKAMIILGVNEGEFPSLPVKSGVFSARESSFLAEFDVKLLPDLDSAVNEERFFFYNCASAPSHYLFVSHLCGKTNRRSPLFSALCRLYGVKSPYIFGSDESDRLFCRKAAMDTRPYLKSQALKAAVKAELCKDKDSAAMLDSPPLQDAQAYIPEDSVSVSYLSYSRVDKYNNCGFAYFMNYVLKLNDKRRINFSSMDSGTYMHHLCEEYLKNRVATGTYVPADRAQTVAELEAISADYISKIMPTPPKKRLKKLIERMQNAVVYVCEDMNKEFVASEFMPIGFEVKIGTRPTDEIPSPPITSSKGVKVNISGSIDRVDSGTVDGKRYVRVVDYKSSDHRVKPEDAAYGEGLQMLSYLFAYCDSKGTGPAGVLYRTLALPEGDKAPTQSGIINDSDEVINAMGDRVKKLRSKISEAEFDTLKAQVYGHIKDTADKISEGVMCVSPFKKRKQECKYCSFGEVCRMKKEEPKW